MDDKKNLDVVRRCHCHGWQCMMGTEKQAEDAGSKSMCCSAFSSEEVARRVCCSLPSVPAANWFCPCTFPLRQVKHKFDTVRGDPKAPANDGFLKITAFNDGGVIKSARVRLGGQGGGCGAAAVGGGAWLQRLLSALHLCLHPCHADAHARVQVRSVLSSASWQPTAANPVVRISARINLPAGELSGS